MPSPEQILTSLQSIANEYIELAIAWHLVFAFVITMVALVGWRPTRRLGGALLAAPFASVSALAAGEGLAFNGIVFAVLAVASIGYAMRLAREQYPPPPRWQTYAGYAVLAFGLLYPHFVAVGNPIAYVMTAPVGLIPCPTLAAVIGLVMVIGAPSRLHGWMLVVAALFYGVFGVLRLGVWLDVGLLIAGALLAAALVRAPGGARPAEGRPTS